ACWAVGVECAEHQGQPVYEACFYTTLERAIEGMWSCAHYTVHASLDRSEDPPDPEDVDRRNVARQKRERRYQTHLLREIFGNPFRPVTLDPPWLTSPAVALAQGIDEERAFDRMPILADALQDAGCDCADILEHCRDPKGGHVRGCWVVDLVLGKS